MTATSVPAAQVVAWFVLRWQLEVTFEEARAQLGIETERQWCDLAILRTTPALLGLFSLATLVAHRLLHDQHMSAHQVAWFAKDIPTFADTLAFARQHLWPVTRFWMSPIDADVIQIPRTLLNRMADALAFAA